MRLRFLGRGMLDTLDVTRYLATPYYSLTFLGLPGWPDSKGRPTSDSMFRTNRSPLSARQIGIGATTAAAEKRLLPAVVRCVTWCRHLWTTTRTSLATP